MADNEMGYESELGSRNYRPEYPAPRVREHKVFWPQPHTVPYAVKHLRGLGALHRAVFLAAAHAGGGYFLDLMQLADEIPVPLDRPWAAILNDDEPSRGGAKGPNFFHETSLRLLLENARTIVVSSAGADASVYNVACDRTATHRENCLLIETQPSAERAWMTMAEVYGRGRHTLVKEGPKSRDWTVEKMLKRKAWRNPF